MKKIGNRDKQREEQTKKWQKRKIPWYERPEYTWNQPDISRGRSLLKQNSRADPSPSIKRKPTHLKKQPERNKDLQVKLCEKLSFLEMQDDLKPKNEHLNMIIKRKMLTLMVLTGKNWVETIQMDGPEKKDFKNFDPLPKKKLSKKQG